MGDSSSSMLRLIRAVRSRLLLVSLMQGLPTSIGWGAALSGLWIALARLGIFDTMKLHALSQWTADQSWYWMVSGAIGCCIVVVSIIRWVRSDRSLDHAAAVIDRQLHLRDRIRSGLAFVMQTNDASPSQQLAIQDALARCSTIAPNQIVSISSGFGNHVGWSVSGLVLAATVSAGLWLPEHDTSTTIALNQTTAAQRVAAQQIVSQVTSKTRQQIEDATAQHSNDGQIQSTLASKLDELEQIEEELTQHDTTPEQALARSAEALGDAADAIEQQATQEALTSDMLTDELKQSLAKGTNPTPAPGESSPIQDMLDALSQGDMAAAQQAAETLSRELPDMDQAAKERLAKDLQELAKRLEQHNPPQTNNDKINPTDNTHHSPATPPSKQTDPDRDALEEQLQQQGIQDPDSLSNQTDKKTIEHELEKQGVNPSNARKLADNIAQRNQHKQAREQSRKELEQLKNAAKKAADDLQQQTSDHKSMSRSPASDQKTSDAPSTQPTNNTPTQQPDTQPTEKATPPIQQTKEPSKHSSTHQHNSQQQTDRTRARSTDGASKPDFPPKQPSPQQQVPKSIEQLKDQLKKMADRQRDAEKKKGLSRSMRKQAEQLLKHASPEQRQDLEQLAREMNSESQRPSQHAPGLDESLDSPNRMTHQEDGQGPGIGRDGDEADGTKSAARQDTPWQHEAFDARGKPNSHENQPSNNQIIADWLDPNKTNQISDGQNTSATARAPQTLKPLEHAVAQAAKISEKQAIPRNRRDLIRRVFDRFAQRAKRTKEVSPTREKPLKKND